MTNGAYQTGVFRITFFNVTIFLVLFRVILEQTLHYWDNFLLCLPSQRPALSQVPSQVATLQKIGSLLWAGEAPDLNPGLLDNMLNFQNLHVVRMQRVLL